MAGPASAAAEATLAERDRLYRARRDATEASWREREAEVKRRLLALHQEEMSSAPESPYAPTLRRAPSPGAVRPTTAPSPGVTGATEVDGAPVTPSSAMPLGPSGGASWAAAKSAEALGALASELRRDLEEEADALRAQFLPEVRRHLRAHQLALAEQAKTQARYAEERESLLRQAMVGAAQRLVEYVEAAAHGGGGADADAARRIGLSPAAAARARSRRPRRSAALLALGAICVTAGIASTALSTRPLWGAPADAAASGGAAAGASAASAPTRPAAAAPAAAPAAAEARGGLPPALSRVVGLLRRLRVDPSAAASEMEGVPGLLHPLERPFALPFYL